jgi:glycerophosphoryl diester phosphodiesterase
VERGNTLAAFRRAVELGADLVELDARRTRDRVVIVNHDASIEGTPLVTLSRAEVARRAPWIPDLTDALVACSPAWVDLEIKNAPADPDWDPDDPVLAFATPLIDDRVLVTSFNPTAVARARGLGMRTGRLLSWSDDPQAVLATWPGHEYLLPSKELVPATRAAALVAAAEPVGATVGIWTIDDPEAMRAYASAGVDIVFTNVPDVAMAALS